MSHQDQEPRDPPHRAAYYDTPWTWDSPGGPDPVPANVRPNVNRLRQALATIRDHATTAELEQAMAEELNQSSIRWITQTAVSALFLDVRGPPENVTREERQAHRALVEEDGGENYESAPDVRPDPPRGPSAAAKAAAAALYGEMGDADQINPLLAEAPAGDVASEAPTSEHTTLPQDPLSRQTTPDPAEPARTTNEARQTGNEPTQDTEPTGDVAPSEDDDDGSDDNPKPDVGQATTATKASTPPPTAAPAEEPAPIKARPKTPPPSADTPKPAKPPPACLRTVSTPPPKTTQPPSNEQMSTSDFLKVAQSLRGPPPKAATPTTDPTTPKADPPPPPPKAAAVLATDALPLGAYPLPHPPQRRRQPHPTTKGRTTIPPGRPRLQEAAAPRT